MKIKKAVIPAAGLGTRFLPVTKSMPKEMLPLLNVPAIHYVVEEAVLSGIDDVIIITGRGKRSIEDYFDDNPEINMSLKKQGKENLLKKVETISSLADVHFIDRRNQGVFQMQSLKQKNTLEMNLLQFSLVMIL